MMKMFFNNDRGFTLLFKELKISSKNELAGACVVLIVIGVAYEILKAFRQNYNQHSTSSGSGRRERESGSQDELLSQGYGAITRVEPVKKPSTPRFSHCRHFVQTLCHMIQLFVAYVLMLAVMTYNAWICASVILGSGLGYYFSVVFNARKKVATLG